MVVVVVIVVFGDGGGGVCGAGGERVASCLSDILVYPRDESALATVRAATLR